MPPRRGFCSPSVVIVQQAGSLAAPSRNNRKDGLISATDTERETGNAFAPKFDAAGLLAAIVQHAETGEVLMFAFMDAEALAKTRETGLAHFHSRSRGKLWMKGETSGHVLRVQQILVDCDQDALVVKALPEGPACHTGARSCFYRELGDDGLSRID
jgi:phosphoribosyl-AMP cyclohydrolase